MATGERLDLVLFGATGFTGKYGVEVAAQLADEKKDFTWGIAGRSRAKLEDVLTEASKSTGLDLGSIPIIEADVSDYDSLVKMAQRARVVVNYVGPYRFYGEPVVKACIEGGASQVDVSGEPQFIERMELLYNKEAAEKGVYIVSACGFDSVPSDMGTVFLEDKFEGELNSVEIYLSFSSPGGGGGATIHYGTWESLIHGIASYSELKQLRAQLYPKRMPKPTPKLQIKSLLHYSETVQKWCLPFPGADRSIVNRSQRFFFENQKKRPVQVGLYYTTSSLFMALLTIVAAGLLGILSSFRPGRWLLKTFPRFFSFGMVSHEGPSREVMDKAEFKLVLHGEGWSEKLSEPTDTYKDPPNKTMIAEVKGKNPGYGATNVMLLVCALTLLKQKEKIPGKGGVLTTAAAFAKTNLIDELNKQGVTFEVVKK